MNQIQRCGMQWTPPNTHTVTLVRLSNANFWDWGRTPSEQVSKDLNLSCHPLSIMLFKMCDRTSHLKSSSRNLVRPFKLKCEQSVASYEFWMGIDQSMYTDQAVFLWANSLRQRQTIRIFATCTYSMTIWQLLLKDLQKIAGSGMLLFKNDVLKTVKLYGSFFRGKYTCDVHHLRHLLDVSNAMSFGVCSGLFLAITSTTIWLPGIGPWIAPREVPDQNNREFSQRFENVPDRKGRNW